MEQEKLVKKESSVGNSEEMKGKIQDAISAIISSFKEPGSKFLLSTNEWENGDYRVEVVKVSDGDEFDRGTVGWLIRKLKEHPVGAKVEIDTQGTVGSHSIRAINSQKGDKVVLRYWELGG